MKNILLVDDHQIIIDGLKRLLLDEEGIGNLFEAKNGSETFSIIEEEEVDLILLDINLPDMSGFDICKKLKAEESCPRIIALTMHDNAGYINKMIKSGVDGYLLKNTGKAELLKAAMRGRRTKSGARCSVSAVVLWPFRSTPDSKIQSPPKTASPP